MESTLKGIRAPGSVPALCQERTNRTQSLGVIRAEPFGFPQLR